MKRTKIIIANWKMNLTVPEATVLLSKYLKEINFHFSEVVVCPSFIDIYSASEAVAGSEIALGAQDAYFEDRGSFTGEVSAAQLFGFVEYCIVGHSERRQLFGETDKTVAKKAAACVRNKITPIICVGETLHEKEDGLTNLVVAGQVEASLAELTPSEVAKSIIAYEPVWAIGTGHVCSAEKAEDVAKKIRNLVKVLYGEGVSEGVRIIYGGSLNNKNVHQFLNKNNLDGFLVGGSSLDHEVFAGIVAKVEESEAKIGIRKVSKTKVRSSSKGKTKKK